ncbi:MAG: hypothetical protein R2712_12835 [Vicinamibacterales bacterium]
MTGHARRALGVGVMGTVLAGCAVLAADRPLAWIRPGLGSVERELNAEARRGLRLAAVSDGLPCSVAVLQAVDAGAPPVEYRVVRDKDVPGALDDLIAGGFVPRASTRVIGGWYDVVFERVSGAPAPGRWRAIEFEKLDDLPAAVTAAAAEGYRARVLVRPPFRSWPGLSARGVLLAERSPAAGPVESRTVVATRKDVADASREVAAATRAGWQLDLLFTQTRDGSPQGRRERAIAILGRDGRTAADGRAIVLERRSSFGLVGKLIVGAAPYWDEYLFASADVDRHQAWASPIRVDAGDADCGPLGFAFRSSAPRDMAWPVVGLLAKPAVNRTDFELILVTDQGLGAR